MLTEQQFIDASKILHCEPACIKAVNAVESNGSGYLKDGTGRLRILFEGHQFWRALLKRLKDPHAYGPEYSNVLYPHWDKSKYKGGAAEWDRLNLAATINKEAALESASWGAFQIMGFNYHHCSFKNVFEMVEFMQLSEFNQLICFLRYVDSAGLADELQKHNWAKFAEGYNGPGYKGNPTISSDDYDLKLARAYTLYSTHLN